MEKREVEGTVRAKHRKKAENAPIVPTVLIDSCPGLTELGKKHWPAVRAVLRELPVTAASDMIAVQRFTEAYAQVMDFQDTLDDEGRVYKALTKEGFQLRPHPLVAQLEDAERRLRMYMNEFGLTPASRSKVKSDGDDNAKKDPLENLGL